MKRPARVVLSLPAAFGGDRAMRAVQPAAIVWQRDRRVSVERPRATCQAVDLIAALEEELRRAGRGARAVGFFAYEFAGTLDPLLALPPGRSLLPDAWWAVLTPSALVSGAAVRRGGWRADVGAVQSSLDDAAFCRGVERIRAAIAGGEVYQVNLTRRFSLPFHGDAAASFAALVQPESAPFACYLADREQGWAVLCLSPELLLRRRGAFVETRPIKGTVARPIDPRKRSTARRRLAASAKDAAELAMIVDVERNDLHRVCWPASVRVQTPRRTMTTISVIHQYATISGQLQEPRGWQSLLAAMLPGGSVTGAPKRAACSFIARLESVPRAVYCGAIGVLQQHRGVLALPIRTGYVTAGMLHVHAGCGIVWDSNAAAEEAESRAKLARWFEVLHGGAA